MTLISRQPCHDPKCSALHGVISRPRPRTGDRNLSGAGVDRQTEATASQPVGASAPERQVSPPPGLSTTG